MALDMARGLQQRSKTNGSAGKMSGTVKNGVDTAGRLLERRLPLLLIQEVIRLVVKQFRHFFRQGATGGGSCLKNNGEFNYYYSFARFDCLARK